MKQLLVASLAVLFMSASALVAAEPKSGLEVGERPGAFQVRDVTGPSKGKSLCYRCQYGNKPVVTIFTREINEDVAKLVKELDGVVGENQDQKMSAFVVLLTDDPDAAESKLEALAKDNKIKNIPLTIFDGVAGPPEYKISEDAALNVMMWVKSDVKVNHAMAKAKVNKKTSAKIVADTKKILN